MSDSSRRRSALACSVGVAVWLVSGASSAFCRTTTCDLETDPRKPPPPGCEGNAPDANGCSTLGKPLYWPGRCAWFGVQKDGSKLHGGIAYETFHDLVKQAFAKWAGADCGGGLHPSFDMTDTDDLFGPPVCDAPEFNGDAANASVWMFRDSSWPYDSKNALGLTHVYANVETGAIYDADTEVNSFGANISTSDTSVEVDLDSIVTHEAGHFLGLAHSLDPDATMNRGYTNHTTSLRDLAPDDVAAICTAYPPAEGAPTCGEPEPLYGFSLYCGGVNPSTKPVPVVGMASGGCSMAPSHGGSTAPAWVALGALAVWQRRRRRLPAPS